MANNANFQDWDPVVFKKNPKNTQTKQTETIIRPKGYSVPKPSENNDGDVHVDAKVSPELKKRVIQLRTSQQKPLNTQTGFATSINVPCDKINKLEAGLLPHKEAKQIALKMERRFKVKVLENLN